MKMSEISEISHKNFFPLYKIQYFALLCILMLHPHTVTYAVCGMLLHVHTPMCIVFHCHSGTVNSVQEISVKICTKTSIVHNVFIFYINGQIQLVFQPSVLFSVGIDLASVKTS